MARTRLNPQLAKLHRSYTVEELSRLYDVQRKTDRAWIDRDGLPAIDDAWPILIQGSAMRAFLGARHAAVPNQCDPITRHSSPISSKESLVKKSEPTNGRRPKPNIETYEQTMAKIKVTVQIPDDAPLNLKGHLAMTMLMGLYLSPDGFVNDVHKPAVRAQTNADIFVLRSAGIPIASELNDFGEGVVESYMLEGPVSLTHNLGF